MVRLPRARAAVHPTRTAPGLARWLPTVTVVAGVVFQVMALLRATPLDPPLEELSSPLAVPAISGGGGAPGQPWPSTPWPHASLPRSCCWCAPGVAPRESPGGSCSGWWPARCLSRRRVIAAFAVSVTDHTEVAGIILGAAMVALVVGAGLSVLRYRLYDVERVVTESAAYAVASAAVLVVYIGVVVVVSRSGPVDAGSQLTTIAATLAGVGVARVSYVWGRRAVGRRVNPTRFHAVEAVRAGLTHPSADLDELVADALGAGARVVYPAAGGGWVTSDGRAVEPSADGVDVRRHDDLVARLEFDPRESGVMSSRRSPARPQPRWTTWRCAPSSPDRSSSSASHGPGCRPPTSRSAVASSGTCTTVRSSGCSPSPCSCSRPGSTATATCSSPRPTEPSRSCRPPCRSCAPSRPGCSPRPSPAVGCWPPSPTSPPGRPWQVSYDVVDERFPSDIESAAWFVVAEAVTNAVKHSGAGQVAVQVRRTTATLCVEIRDEGVGAADPSGSGLQGLADRVAAVGGSLRVSETDPHGTVVEAVFPCAS